MSAMEQHDSDDEIPVVTAESWKAKGNEFYKAKDYKAAVDAYTQSIKLDSTNAALLTNRAAACLMILDYKQACLDCDAALAIDRTNVKAYFRKATALKGLGNIDDAIVALDAGLQYDPSSASALSDRQVLINAKTKVVEIQSLVQAKRFNIALPQIEALLKEVGSGFRDLNLLKVQVLIELGRQEDAYNLTNAMMRTAQNGDVELLKLRAQCFFCLGDLENAVKHLQQALRSDPDNSNVRNFYRSLREIEDKKSKGDDCFKRGEFDNAIGFWTECIDLSKDNKPFGAKLHLNRGTAWFKQKQYEKAVKDCNLAIYYNSAYVKAFNRRAECYMALGGPENIEKAINDYEAMGELENDEGAIKDIKKKIKKAKVALKRSKRKDLYAILGVSQQASDSEIKTAYRKGALKYHPDKQASKSEAERAKAETLFKSIGEAYDVLSDPEKKERYDQGVELEDLDNPHAGGGGGHGGGHSGMGGIDPNILFQMFAQQQRSGRR